VPPQPAGGVSTPLRSGTPRLSTSGDDRLTASYEGPEQYRSSEPRGVSKFSTSPVHCIAHVERQLRHHLDRCFDFVNASLSQPGVSMARKSGSSGVSDPVSLTGRTLLRQRTRPLVAGLVLLLASALPAQAQHRVSGRVTAPAGEGIPSVLVSVQGTTVTALSDQEGRYALTAPSASHVLVFARIGYGTQEAPIDGQSVVNVTLSVTATELAEIVVTGYGQKTRATLTESIGTVSREQIERVPVSSPEASIVGRVSGVQVISESGVPGAPVAVRVRGIGTVGNTQPLYVIDGIPIGRGTDATSSPLATINPADIESISILKDASAAAMYGVQAANGVVLIQTRRGTLGKPTIRYDGYQGVQSFQKRYDMLNTEQWFGLARESFDNFNQQFGYTPDNDSYRALPQYLLDNEAALRNRNTDWHDVVAVKNAPMMNHNLSVSGAADRVSYYISGGVFKQDAIVDRWDMTRLSFRANSDFQITDRIRFGENFSISNQRTLRGQQNNFNGQLLPNSLSLPPFFRYRDEDGSVPGNRYGFTGNQEFADAGLTFGNEPALNQIVENRDREVRVLGGLFGEVDLLAGLTVRSQGNLDYGTTRDNRWNPSYTRGEIGLDRNDTNVEQRTDSWGLVWTNTATYTRALGSHNFNVLGGIELQSYKNTGTQIEMTNFLTDNPAFRQIAAAGSDLLSPPAGWAGERGFLGYLGRVNYNYNDKYLLTASMRRDGASTFAPQNRWGNFPAVSAGWRISEESFFNVPWLSELKLRGSWGRMGNSEVPGAEYPHLFQVNDDPDYGLNGETVVKAPVPRGFVNPDLVWETSETVDVGFESGLLNNAVSFSATYYTRNTKDFLVNVPLPLSSGFPAGAPVNSGKVRNSGIEVEAGYNVQLPSGVALFLSGNLTTVKNRLVELREDVEEYVEGNGYRTAVGKPIDYFFGYKTCGIYQTAQEAAAAPPDANIGNNRPQAGDMCFADVNGDGEINADDRTRLGKTIPGYFYGINLSATFRRLDLSVFFNGVGDVQAFNRVRQSLDAVSGGSSNRSVAVLDRWTPTNPSNTVPRAVVGDPNNNGRFSERWVEDANYFRLRNLQLGFTLPDGWLGTRTRLYVAATNLFTITPYDGLDPEFTTSIDFTRSRNDRQRESRTDNGNLPQPRVFQIGVSTAF
jgi:TonB-linked SusC/RagA family outer membrane protein